MVLLKADRVRCLYLYLWMFRNVFNGVTSSEKSKLLHESQDDGFMNLRNSYNRQKFATKFTWCHFLAGLFVVGGMIHPLFIFQSRTTEFLSAEKDLSIPTDENATAVTATVQESISTTAHEEERGSGCPNDQQYIWLVDDLDPLTSTQRTEFTSTTINKKKKIPNILYQTAKGRCIERDVYDVTTRTWLNSTEYVLRYQFYDDIRMDEYLYNETHWKSSFPGLSLALQCIEHTHLPVMKTDLWRYLILWEEGGIFADLDVGLDSNQSLLQHLQEYDDDAVFILDHQQDRPRSPGMISQWLMAVCPEHPLMYYAIETAITLVLKSRRAIPIQHTGPRALKDATDRFLTNSGTTTTMPKTLEGNTVYTEPMDLNVSSSSEKLYSFHVTPASWARNLAFPEAKQRMYASMNMTHYRNNRKGKKHYDNGARCLEFLGGTLHEDGKAFSYSGTSYLFHNPLPSSRSPP